MKKPNPREEGEEEGGDIKAATSCVRRNKERRSRFYLAKQRSEAAVGAKSCGEPSRVGPGAQSGLGSGE